MKSRIFLLMLTLVLVAACSDLGRIVPTTGDTSSDASAAQQFLPTVPGYTSVEARNITDAITSVGGSASLITGNIAVAAAITKIDAVMQCYEGVGAVAARVYTDANISQVTQGQLPKAGVVAIINRNRAARNLLSCTLGTQSGPSAMSAEFEPCGGTGSFVAGGETLDYIYAATSPELCTAFTQQLPSQ